MDDLSGFSSPQELGWVVTVPWKEEGGVGTTGVFFTLSEQTQQTEHRGCCSCGAEASEKKEIDQSLHNSIYLRKEPRDNGIRKQQHKQKTGKGGGSPLFPPDIP